MSDQSAREVRIAGNQLRCQVCDYPRFLEREGRIDTTASGFGLEGTQHRATCFVCEACGYIHWFQPSSARGPDLAEDLDALGRLTAAELDELRAR